MFSISGFDFYLSPGTLYVLKIAPSQRLDKHYYLNEEANLKMLPQDY